MRHARLLAALLCLASCTRAELKDPSQAMRAKSGTTITDDLDFRGLTPGLAEQSAWLKRTDKPLRFGDRVVDAQAYATRLDGLAAAIDGNTPGAAEAYLAEHFETFEVYGDDDWGEVKLTSYYEPVIKGSRVSTDVHTEPLLGRPDDLLTINTAAYWEPISGVSSMRGRLEPERVGRVIPYFSRQEIYQGALAGRGLELVYVDPVEAFFMQIQGSGSVELEDGAVARFGYADQNGHPYVAIGRFLLDVIDKEAMSMEAIAMHLRSLPLEKRVELLVANPSYVFFEPRTGPAVTANTTTVIPGRTIATDAKFFPKGALAMLTFALPDGTGKSAKVSRLVVDQDTGGAIRGGGRVDLFWGSGPEAGRIAGAINQAARLVYLVPKL